MTVLLWLRRLGVMLLGMIVLVAVLSLVQMPMRAAHVPDAAAAAVIVAVAFGVYLAWVRFVERRDPAELAPRALVPEGLLGLAVGLALFAVVIGVLALAGAFALRGNGTSSALAAGFIGTLAGAVVEEILFRGWLFRTVRALGGTWVGVAVSAVVFGALHGFNPGASAVSTVAVALEAGVLLALAYAATNRLWLPIGLHVGWNYAEGFVFGTAVSGHATTGALLPGVLHGPSLLTGGAFGPEASVVAVAVCLLAAAAFAVPVVRGDAHRRRVTAPAAVVSSP